MRVTALAGGTGAAKLLRGLAACIAPADLTVVGNTGDDAEIWGLHVSPDLDSVLYALAGVLDVERGWGRRDETFRCLDGMGRLGAETWFRLGDGDLATHLVRTRALREGRSLSDVMAELGRRLDVAARIVPASDQPVRTRVRTPTGWLDFQEYFVRDKAQTEVREVRYAGADAARPASGVLEALAAADAVIVCPSNPITSIGPILAVPGIAEALGTTRAVAIAVSPIVGSAAVSGPAGRLMAASALPVSAAGVAQAYRSWLDVLVLDERDRPEAADVERLGVRPTFAPIIMTSGESEVALARRVLAEIREI